MDPSSVLEQTTQDVSNLQAEFQHILEEIRSEDFQLYELRKKAAQKDSQLHKFIRQHGSLTEHPSEKELGRAVREELEQCKGLQRDKCTLANTALFLVAKHLAKLEKSIVLLEEDGLLAPLDNEADSGSELSRESSVMSSSERRRKATSAGSTESTVRRRRQARASPAVAERRTAPKSEEQSDGTPLENNFDLQDYNDDLFSGINNNEEEDKTLYCFCQSVSYGEMVACDGAHCKYEWFHYPCVNLKEPPKGAWFCPDCRQEMAKGRLKKRRL